MNSWRFRLHFKMIVQSSWIHFIHLRINTRLIISMYIKIADKTRVRYKLFVYLFIKERCKKVFFFVSHIYKYRSGNKEKYFRALYIANQLMFVSHLWDVFTWVAKNTLVTRSILCAKCSTKLLFIIFPSKYAFIKVKKK